MKIISNDKIFYKIKNIIKIYLLQYLWIKKKTDIILAENDANEITLQIMSILNEKIKSY